jgi:plastocyanin
MMFKKRYHTCYLFLAACLIGLCFCLIPLAPAKAQGSNATVQILGPLQPPGFFPALLTIHTNDYVTFVNQSLPPATFTIASDNGQFSSPALAPGKMWTITLSNPGAYEFHDAATSPRMVDEVIVVPNTISLLPSPEPGVAATALALVEAGKTLPDNLALITPTPTAGTVPAVSASVGSPLIRLLLIVGMVLLILVLLMVVILLIRHLRRRRRHHREPEEQEIAVILSPPEVIAPRPRLLARLRQRKSEDEDDLEDVDEEI